MITNKKYKEVEICGEKFKVEYFELYSNKESSKFKLSDLWYDITMPFYRCKHKVREIYWEIRYALQRMFKDYDSVDVFEMYYKFINRYTKILTRYKKNMHGYPGTMTEEEWNEIVDKMILHLYWMDEENVTKELEKDVPKNWSLSLKTTQEIMDKHKNEFFKLFSEYFYCLWD